MRTLIALLMLAGAAQAETVIITDVTTGEQTTAIVTESGTTTNIYVTGRFGVLPQLPAPVALGVFEPFPNNNQCIPSNDPKAAGC